MASSKWKSWEELGERLEGKKLVFWGASNWIERTMHTLDAPVSYIVDKSKLNQGIKYCGVDVVPPAKLAQEHRDDVYVVISTANYMSVIEELQQMGFVMGDHFCCTPLLNQRKDKDDLLAHKQTLLISSQQHWSDEKRGGGLPPPPADRRRRSRR